jgi:hypothetical protein
MVGATALNLFGGMNAYLAYLERYKQWREPQNPDT